MYASNHDYRHPGLDSTPAISAIEMACWDIVGKAVNQPIYNLLGGKCHERLRAYAYMPAEGIWENPEKAGEVAAQTGRRGKQRLQARPLHAVLSPAPGLSAQDHPPRPRRSSAASRDAVGDDLEIGIGTHGQFSTAGAIRVAKILEEFDPFWFEEPVPPENVGEMARVAAHTSIPIASGERLVTKYEFAELLEKQAAQIIQLDVGQCGGILESKKIAGMAEAHYAMIAPHMYVGPVAAAASRAARHLLAELPDPGVQRQRPAQRDLRRSHRVPGRIHRAAGRAWARGGARREGGRAAALQGLSNGAKRACSAP